MSEFADDLSLAKRCAQGDGVALKTLDAMISRAAKSVGNLDADGTLVDEVAQALRTQLLVGPRARIADYAGEGPLKGWLKAAAIRQALNFKRPGAKQSPLDSERLAALPVAAPGPELELIRRRHQHHFTQAFSLALESLTPRERTLLKLHLLEGMPLARLGAMYGKDKSTVSRWLTAAQEQLLAVTRLHLEATLQLSPTEFESVIRAAQHDLSLSLSRLLQK